MSGIYAAAGFVSSLGGAPQAPRYIVFPATNPDGTPVTGGSNNQQVYVCVDGYVTIEESHHDEMTITEHPVEQGAAITDHAFRVPAQLKLRLGWSAAGGSQDLSVLGVTLPTLSGLFGSQSANGLAYLNSVYAELLGVMTNRNLLTVYTGKRPYSNMLIQSVDEETTDQTANSLILTVTLREINLVNTSTVKVPINASATADPKTATPTTAGGQKSPAPATTLNPGAAPAAPATPPAGPFPFSTTDSVSI